MVLSEETGVQLSPIFFLHPGSIEERESMEKALSFIRPVGMVPRARFASVYPMSEGSSSHQILPPEPVPKTGLHLEITNEAPLHPGNPLELAITVKTSTPGKWTINLVGSCQLQSYTGKVEASLGYVKETVELEGESGRHRKVAVFCGLFTVSVWDFTQDGS